MRISSRTLPKLACLLLSCFVTACQPQKETIIERFGGNQQPNEKQGPGDIGGGNGVDGKPLESFRIHPSKLSQYSEIQKIVSALSKKHERLAADFAHILEDRTWYFVPVALELIDPRIIGTHFKIDQLALQSRFELWFDTTRFETMSPEHRIQLIVHELVMGVRLMEFQSLTDECLSSAFVHWNQGKKEEYNEARRKCLSNVPPIPSTKKFQLTDEDYANIRYLAARLVNDFDSVDPIELSLWLSNKGFRKY